MPIILIITFIVLTLTAFSGIAAAFYLLGVNNLQRKMLVESKRRENKLTRDLQTWQTFTVRKSGLGELKREKREKASDNDPKPATPRVVSASQAVRLEQQSRSKLNSNFVPPEVAEKFLAENRK